MIATQWPRLAAALLGFLWYLSIGGGPTLDPTNIQWLLEGDWQQHWLGWLFFRHEPWAFPLGTITSLSFPIGTNIGFTDSNPLVSLLLKPFSGVLPAEFQFIGPWLAFCFALQGYMGAALASVVTKDRGQQLLGGYLFVLSPVLVARVSHDTLCAHGLLLGLLYLGLRDYADTHAARRGSWLAMAIVLIASMIHPYLAAMSLVLALACFARLWLARWLTLARATVTALATIAGLLLVFSVIGYFNGSRFGSTGFGYYSADLLTLIDSTSFSGILPRLTRAATQREGLGFLGLGGLVAAAIGIVLLIRRRPALGAGRWAVVLASVLMGIYALSVFVMFRSHTAFKLHWLFDPFESITSSFRSSGRFIWPVHYLALLFGIWGVTQVMGAARQSAATVLLAVVVILQATDLQKTPLELASKKFRQASLAIVEPAAGRYRHLALFPMQVLTACGEPFDPDHVYRFMLQAYRMKLTYNSGIFARLPKPEVQAECARQDQQVTSGKLDPQTIYVTAETNIPMFKGFGASCGRFDGDWMCVSADSDQRVRTFLETGKVP